VLDHFYFVIDGCFWRTHSLLSILCDNRLSLFLYRESVTRLLVDDLTKDDYRVNFFYRLLFAKTGTSKRGNSNWTSSRQVHVKTARRTAPPRWTKQNSRRRPAAVRLAPPRPAKFDGRHINFRWRHLRRRRPRESCREGSWAMAPVWRAMASVRRLSCLCRSPPPTRPLTTAMSSRYNFIRHVSPPAVVTCQTRKLSYRKDYRAMCPIYGCPENFQKSLSTPITTFSRNFQWAFVLIDLMNGGTKFEVHSFTRSWDNSDWSFRWGLRIPNLGEEETVGGRGWYRSKERWWVPIGPPYLYTFQRYCCLCAPARHFFPPTSSLPQIFPCSPRSRWVAFGLQRANGWANCSCN